MKIKTVQLAIATTPDLPTTIEETCQTLYLAEKYELISTFIAYDALIMVFQSNES